MDSGGGNTGSSDPAKTSTVENATNSLPGCGCSSANNITVRVTPTTGGQFDLQVAKTESVENFKKLISKKLKVPKERICLLHRDRQLREGTLQENQLMDGSRLTLLPSVETGLLAQRPEQSVMQALESLNDTQVNDFLSGKAPLNLTMRLGDHMMLIQLQLSTVTPSSSRRSSGGSSNSSSSTSTSSTSASTSTTTTTTAAAATTNPTTAAAASSFTASPSPSASLSKSAPFVGVPAHLSPALAAPSLSSVIAASPSLSSVIAAAAASAAASAAAAAAAAASGSSSHSHSHNHSHSSSGLGDLMMTNSRTASPPSIPSSSGFAKAPVAAATSTASPRSSSFTTATSTSAADCVGVHHPASPAPCPAAAAAATTASAAAAASPHPSPLKFLEEAASFLPKAPSSTYCPTAAAASSTSSSSFTSTAAAAVASTSSSSSPSHPSSSSQSQSSSFHTAQPSTSSSTPSTPSSSPTASPSSSSTSSPTTAAAAAAPAGAAATAHACGYGNGSSGCKCEAPAAKPMLDTRALAEASRNLTQTLKQLSSEVLTSRSDAAEDSPRGGRRQGAIIESMHHHGKGVYSGTFSGTLNPALQDRYGRPKRDISTIIHILNDLLCATPQYRRHTRQGHSISVEATGSTVPKKGTNTSDKNSSSLEFMEESGSLSRENQATRGKMEHLRLIMEERRARRRARREARAAPYTTQWSAKSESLPQSSAMGHDTVEPMETGEQSSSTASSEQQLCELNPPEPVVA